jgi:hypothetical protein
MTNVAQSINTNHPELKFRGEFRSKLLKRNTTGQGNGKESKKSFHLSTALQNKTRIFFNLALDVVMWVSVLESSSDLEEDEDRRFQTRYLSMIQALFR